MFGGHLFFVLSLEIVFYGFICLASGSLKSGYIAILFGAIFLSFCGILKQELRPIELFTPENIAASTLLLALFVGIPFRLMTREKRPDPETENDQLPLLRR